jgi:hypothetical protein
MMISSCSIIVKFDGTKYKSKPGGAGHLKEHRINSKRGQQAFLNLIIPDLNVQ